MARAGKLPYGFAIFDRWIRFMPSIAALTALEFLWPLLFSGPFFTRVAEFNLKKCTDNWYHNLIFTNNLRDGVIDIVSFEHLKLSGLSNSNVLFLAQCGGHTFSSSVDFHLFILGLIAVALMIKSPRFGVLFSYACIIGAHLRIGYVSHVNATTGSMLTPDPVPRKIVEYLNYIHMATPIYIPSYFMGFLSAHYLMTGFRVKLTSVRINNPLDA